MNFELTAEQQLLSDSVERFVSDNYSIEQRRAIAGSKGGFSDDHWQAMANLGWLALPFAEDQGGIGGSQVDTMVLMQQFGRGLVVEPYLASVVLAGSVLRRCANRELQERFLPTLIDGSQRWSLAHAEPTPSSSDANGGTTTQAQQQGEQYTINGSKTLVINGASAHWLIVSATLDSGTTALFALDAQTNGVVRHGYPMMDGTQAAEIELHEVLVPASARLDTDAVAASQLLEQAETDALLALCAEAVGAIGMLYQDTVEYTKQREQFGHTLAQFQVVKHRLVDLFVEYEQCQSLLYRATLEVAEELPGAGRSVHALKYLVGTTGVNTGEEAVQLHGGMGMTEELRVAHYFKRLLVIESLFGDSDHHLEQFASA